jgi:hypothetical protein
MATDPPFLLPDLAVELARLLARDLARQHAAARRKSAIEKGESQEGSVTLHQWQAPNEEK